MKKCPFCAEEIQDEAIVCKHCGRDLTNPKIPLFKQAKPTTRTPFKILGVMILLMVAGLIIAVVASSPVPQSNSSITSGTDPQAQNTPDPKYFLNADVTHGPAGVVVTNKELTDWSDCMVGVNGSTGWNFDKPPYQTHTPFTILAGKTLTVPYTNMTTQDGTRFDISSHVVNSIVVDCGMDNNNERSWVGTPK